MKKKIISFLTSLVMVISLIGIVPTMTAGASGGVQEKITALANQYNGVKSEFSNSYQNWSASQCYGYARMITNNIFGNPFHRQNSNGAFYKAGSGSSCSALINIAKPGDVLNRGSIHTAVVVYTTSSSIVVTHYTKGYARTTTITSSNYSSWLGGTYDVWRANNYDSVDGPNTLPTAPTNVRTTSNRTSFTSKETIEFQWDYVPNANDYWVYMWKDGKQIYATDIGNSNSFTSAPTSPGNYTLIVRAGNSFGYSNGKAEISFVVSDDAPTYSNVWIPKGFYDWDSNEKIQINVSTSDANGQVIRINSVDENLNYISIVKNEESSTCYEINAKSLGIGYFSAYFTLYNGSGGTDTKKVYFYIGQKKDIGTNFYARIKNQSNNKYLTNSNGNVDGRIINCSKEQIWKFEKQSDNSYKLINAHDNNAMDVDNFGNSGAGTNVHVYNNWDSTAQRFYIYKVKDAYYFKSACTDMVLDLSQTTNNLEVWGCGFDWSPQKFDIEKVNQDDVGIHKYVDSLVAPTLKEQGYTLHKCSVCGDEYKDNYVKPLNETELKYQLAKLDNGKYAVRYLLIVNEETALKAEKASIFLTRNNGEKTKEIPFKTAYRNVKAGRKTVSAGKGKVFLTAMYNNIPEIELNNLKATLNIDKDIYYRTITH